MSKTWPSTICVLHVRLVLAIRLRQVLSLALWCYAGVSRYGIQSCWCVAMTVVSLGHAADLYVVLSLSVLS